MTRKYDIIIFGATGFTGKYCVEDVVKLQEQKSPNYLHNKFTWAVAGRSKAKLTQVLQEVSDFTGVDVTTIDKIVADVSDEDSLRKMASQCSVVVNCVGPYQFYGEQVVKACLQEKASHVDLSGEQLYLEKVQIDHNKEAEKNGVYIIGTCGIESIPADCGLAYLYQIFDGDINSVDCYLEGGSRDKDKYTKFHFGTYQSCIHNLAQLYEIRALHKTLLCKKIPQSKYQKSKWFPFKYSDVVKGFVSLFPATNLAVVERSQYHFYTRENRRPIQYNAYVKFPGFFNAIAFWALLFIVAALSQFSWGRNLLETYPRVFTLGGISHDGPTREEAESVDAKFTLVASGWKEKLLDPTDQHVEPPNKTLKLEVQAKNPGYGATATIFIESALTVAFEKDKLPSTGGVLTPGVAFEKTTLIDRLNSRGVTFQIKE